eukprot:7282432-Prymnesium_polylepis.1
MLGECQSRGLCELGFGGSRGAGCGRQCVLCACVREPRRSLRSGCVPLAELCCMGRARVACSV